MTINTLLVAFNSCHIIYYVTMKIMFNIDKSVGWAVLNELARIHHIPRKKRVKGGVWQRRTKAEVAKDVRRVLGRTFPDRMRRTNEVLQRLRTPQVGL